MRHGAPKLSDVARRAGVSTATVSRCLNTPDKVHQTTRDRVQAAVEELGYAPNFAARVLAARQTNTIAAIVPTLENAIFARGLEAFQQELARHDVITLLASSSYDQEIEEGEIRTLVARGADALLLIGYDRAPHVYDYLDRRGVPYVIAWAHDPASPRIAVGFDNRRAMRTLTERAIDLGHRRIGLLTAHRATNDRARYRWLGIRDAMADRGLDPETLQVIEASYAFEAGRDGLQRLMEAPDPPTLVMCGNDVLAAGAVSQAKVMGLAVPGDVSITGFDDIELAQIIDPGLTTMHVPHREMGRRAAEVLLALRRGDEAVGSVLLDTYLTERATLGPAPGRSGRRPRGVA